MKGPLVSVITPTFNQARYLDRCIESLIAQTYANWELVIVDDGSTDDTAAVVRSYPDPRIAYVYQENRGVKHLARTINAGVRLTRGELVTMFASDDTWPSYRLERQVPVFEDPQVVLCFGRGVVIDENDRELEPVPLPRFVSEVMNRPVGSVLATMLVSNWLPQYTVLLRRSALEAIGLYQQPEWLYAEDWPTHLALALQGEFRFLDLPLGYYRMHPTQMTRSHYVAMAETDARFALEFFRGLSPEMRLRSGWTEDSLGLEMKKRHVSSYVSAGRRALASGDRKAARRHFAAALWRGNAVTKAKAAVGLACCAVGMDFERVVRRLGRPSLR